MGVKIIKILAFIAFILCIAAFYVNFKEGKYVSCAVMVACGIMNVYTVLS